MIIRPPLLGIIMQVLSHPSPLTPTFARAFPLQLYIWCRRLTHKPTGRQQTVVVDTGT